MIHFHLNLKVFELSGHYQSQNTSLPLLIENVMNVFCRSKMDGITLQ